MRTSFPSFTWALALLTLPLFSASCKDDNKPVTPAGTCRLPELGPNPKAAAYQALLDSYVQRGLPGVVLLVKTPREGLWVGAAGKANLETGEAMTPCTLNYPQSIAKTFTATALMMLVEEGKVSLDAKISQYLPASMVAGIPNVNQATVRQMLNMTSGIPSYERDPTWIADGFANPLRTYNAEIMLSYIKNHPPDFAPGARWEYSTTNYVLAALIIDQVTGKSHADMFTNRIFRPLNLRDIYYKNEPGYPTPRGLLSGSYFDRNGNGTLENVAGFQTASVSSAIGDDGIISSAYDLAQFAEALAKGKLVNQRSLQQMTQWVNTGTTGQQYGLGLYNYATPLGPAIGHGGNGIGAIAQMYYLPEADVTFVAFTNVGGFFGGPLGALFENELPTDVLTILAR